MSNGDSNAGNAAGNESKTILETIRVWVLPVLIAVGGWQFTELSKLEDRVNKLQQESVTQAQLQLSETRTMSSVDLKLKIVIEGQSKTNEFLRFLVDESRNKNKQ